MRTKKETDLKKITSDFLRKDGIFKLYSRNSSVQIAENFAYFCMLELKKFRNLNFQQLMLGRDEFMDVYCRQDEFVVVENTIEKKLNKSKSIKDFFENDGLPIFTRYTSITNQLHNKYLKHKTNSNVELLKDYNKFAQINAEFIAFNFFIYLADPVIDRLLRKLLAIYLNSTNQTDKIQNYLVCVSSPLLKPAVVLERSALLKIIASNKSKNKDALHAHVEKFKWFPCYNPSDDPYDLEHYLNEAKLHTTVSAKNELKNIITEQKKHTSEFKKLLRNIKNNDLKKLINITNKICYYREYRNDLRRQGLCNVRILYDAIGSKLNLTVKEVCYLTNSEIQQSLRSGICSVSKQQIRGRFKHYLIFADINNNIFDDNKELIQNTNKVINNKIASNKILTGTIAVKGIVKGVVRVVSSIKVLHSFKAGEILVASMTAPEYVPAMKKAAAVITDEGGITCHAAIISRELGIPCIVGTKFATKILKDGDLVEVNSENGTVKKL